MPLHFFWPIFMHPKIESAVIFPMIVIMSKNHETSPRITKDHYIKFTKKHPPKPPKNHPKSLGNFSFKWDQQITSKRGPCRFFCISFNSPRGVEAAHGEAGGESRDVAGVDEKKPPKKLWIYGWSTYPPGPRTPPRNSRPYDQGL